MTAIKYFSLIALTFVGIAAPQALALDIKLKCTDATGAFQLVESVYGKGIPPAGDDIVLQQSWFKDAEEVARNTFYAESKSITQFRLRTPEQLTLRSQEQGFDSLRRIVVTNIADPTSTKLFQGYVLCHSYELRNIP